MSRLPEWVAEYNEERPANRFVGVGWSPLFSTKLYVNQINTIFGADRSQKISSFRRAGANDYKALVSSPWGNTLVAEFAGLAVRNESLGSDEATDILNICFDASRYVGQRYGPESMEYEDMIYRLDADIAELVRAITAQVNLGNVLFVLTSDHGTSDAWDAGGEPLERFNPNQFKTILNSFLGVQFGVGDWVLDYIDRQVYLNHNLVYSRNLSLEEVQNRAAAFVLQFRGISHVLTSTAMQNGYFGASYGRRMQNGFYPRRAGDLMLNFMPGWIEERPDTRSLSGSMYDYDTHVPLMMFGWRIPARTHDMPVDMTQLAPTLARILQISRPMASDGVTLPELDHVIN
jgi:predicted AlkP superfamily pyrophosphatase or phosphodiesterase